METTRTNLPPVYLELPDQEVFERIAEAKARLGEDLLILGHHYQQDGIIRFADLTGDSYQLSREAGALQGVRYVVFCGVHFMAESADILTGPEVSVMLPDMRAGCTMADMANLDDVETAWLDIATVDPSSKVIPITYMNSAANLKAFCGERDGAVCTSSNAEAIIRYAFETGDKLMFFPDQHLGRNVCWAMGYDLEQMLLWDPREYLGGNTPEQVRAARIFLWKGHCSVHQGFTRAQIDYWHEKRPEIRILVHPECNFEVVQGADLVGSTNYIIQQVEQAAPGSAWAVGTEIHLVNRLKERFPDRFVTSLSPFQCLCSTMYRIRPPYLLWVLENLLEGNVVNQISVAPDIARSARVALERMISITQAAPKTAPRFQREQLTGANHA